MYEYFLVVDFRDGGAPEEYKYATYDEAADQRYKWEREADKFPHGLRCTIRVVPPVDEVAWD